MSEEIILSSSILSADFSHLEDQIHQAESAGVDWIHVDVMDGHFVPNITMGPFIVETCRRITRLPIDVHLMIENPDRFIDAFAAAGANRLSIHIEGNTHIYRTLQAVRSLGVHPGVVINPGTPASAVTSVLSLVDHVLVMTVNPGFSGQVFIETTLPKITEVYQMLSRLNPQGLVEVDGGITLETIKAVYDAGARAIVAATSIFKHRDGIAAGINSLREAVK